MEKEKVLEIEFQEVFDKVAVRIVYQNEKILERSIFRDEEIGVESVCVPNFKSKTLYLRGCDKYEDNHCELVSKEKVEEIKEKVRKINDKYGIPKSWRAKNGEKYYFINVCYFDIFETTDNYEQFDKTQYELGNYFRTKQEAQSKLDQILQILGDKS